MTNPIPYIRNKFCVWLTGLSLDEIQSLKDRCDELTQDNDWVSKSDFDPDDYDFSPLNDYDFSEFLLRDDCDEQIENFLSNNDYITAEYVKEQIEESIDNLSEGDKIVDRIIEEYENVQVVRIERAVEEAIKKHFKKRNKKKKKDNPPQ